MKWLTLLSVLALSACGPSEQEQLRRKAENEAKREEEHAKYLAKQEQERQLLISSNGIEELKSRLGRWLSVEEGILIIREMTGSVEPKFLWMHGISPQVPWTITCGRGVNVVLGSWTDIGIDSGQGDSDDRYSISLSRAKLTETECAPLVAGLGRRMLEITRTGQ